MISGEGLAFTHHSIKSCLLARARSSSRWQVMGESSVSPYGVAAGHCVAHPPAHTLERWQRAAVPAAPAAETTSTASVTTSEPVGAGGETQPPLPLGGRVYRLTKLAEKPTAEFARENLVTPGLGRGFDGKGKHLVVFGQYVLPTARTFDILAEDIRADRRERCDNSTAMGWKTSTTHAVSVLRR